MSPGNRFIQKVVARAKVEMAAASGPVPKCTTCGGYGSIGGVYTPLGICQNCDGRTPEVLDTYRGKLIPVLPKWPLSRWRRILWWLQRKLGVERGS
jgi:hypothetical protein